MKQLTLFTATFSLLLFSCKKEKLIPVLTEQPSPAYIIPATTGSYWVYKENVVDSLGNVSSTGVIDSVYISGDSIFNGNKFIVYKSSIKPTRLERDSAGYIVNQYGRKEFSYILGSKIFTLNDPNFPGPNGSIDLIAKQDMLSSLGQITLQTGTYAAFAKRTWWYDSNGGPVTTCGDSDFINYTYYVSGIGKVWEEYNYFDDMVSQCNWRYWELIDYHIEP